MATITIPRHEETARLGPLPSVRDQPVSADVFGAAQGRSIAAAGQQLVRSTAPLDEAIRRMRNEQIETDVLAAETARFAPENEMLFSPESGYYALRGRAALDAHQDTIKRHSDLIAEHGKNLTGASKAAYDKRAAARTRDIHAQIMRHAQTEGKAWQTEVAAAHHATVQMSAGTIDPYDDAGIEGQFGRLLASNQRLAEKTGQSMEWAETKSLAEHGQVITSMIRTRMAAHDLPAANRLLSKYGDRLSPDVRGALTAEARAEAEDRTGRIVGGGAAHAARVVGGPEQIDAAGQAIFQSVVVQMESGDRQVTADGDTVMGEPTPYGRAVGASQLLESTAKGVAKAHGIEYSRERLHNDKEYNKQLGRLYYTDLLRKYGGNVYSAYAEWRVGAGNLGDLTEMRPGENITLEAYAAALRAKGHPQSAEDMMKFGRRYQGTKESGAAATSRAAYDEAIAAAPNRHVRQQIEAAYNQTRRQQEIDAREANEAIKTEAWGVIGPIARDPAGLPPDATLASVLPADIYASMPEETRVYFDRILDGARAKRDKEAGPSPAYEMLYAGLSSSDPVVRQNALADYQAHKADHEGAMLPGEDKKISTLAVKAANAPEQLPSALAQRALADPGIKAAMKAAGISGDKSGDAEAITSFYGVLSTLIHAQQTTTGRTPTTSEIAGMADVLLAQARVDTGGFSSLRAALGGGRSKMFEVYDKQIRGQLPRGEQPQYQRTFTVDDDTKAPPEFASGLVNEAVMAGRPAPDADEINQAYRDHLTTRAYQYSFTVAPGRAPIAPEPDTSARPAEVTITLPSLTR